MSGWIKVHRELLKKPIWKNSSPEQKVVLMTVLMTVNYDTNEWDYAGKSFRLSAGQMHTSIDSLVEKCGKNLTPQKVRTALKRFVKLGFLTTDTSAFGTIITVCKWGFYQVDGVSSYEGDNKLLMNHEQTHNKPLATIKEKKEFKESKNPFVSFWDLYNKKKGDKAKCKMVWDNLPKSEQDIILAIIPQWKKQHSDIQYQPFPLKFLKEKRWNDEITTDSIQKDAEPVRIKW